MPPLAFPWRPQSLIDVGDSADTSMGTTEVITDAGRAYLKPMGNRQGPHPLAAEWVATHLARWFGLPTFDVAVLVLGESDCFPLPRGARAAPGPAFISRAAPGAPWDRSEGQLDALVNPEDITRLVVFDTWTLNCDRHPPDLAMRKPNYDNVFLSTEDLEPGRLRLMAMDNGHCFTCGRDLVARNLNAIERMQDDRVYGLFPQFASRVRADIVAECRQRLREVTPEMVAQVMDGVPPQWEVAAEGLKALGDLICRRAAFVADRINQQLAPLLGERA